MQMVPLVERNRERLGNELAGTSAVPVQAKNGHVWEKEEREDLR